MCFLPELLGMQIASVGARLLSDHVWLVWMFHSFVIITQMAQLLEAICIWNATCAINFLHNFYVEIFSFQK